MTMVICPDCDGTGDHCEECAPYEHGCLECDGTGYVNQDDIDYDEFESVRLID